ncbi:conserved hypothetical protein [Mesorhizobium sp. ORS 3324]|nr:conserved hypothetical protein [Mesorhizobium sp. ORS 3324]
MRGCASLTLFASAQNLHILAENLLRSAPSFPLRPAIQAGMRTHAKPRWSLPYRLRYDGWWLAEPQRMRASATVLPFVPRSRRIVRKARKAGP